MNPMSPKISHSLKEIEEVYAGQEAAHAYFDHKNKVYVLVGRDRHAVVVPIRAIGADREVAVEAANLAAVLREEMRPADPVADIVIDQPVASVVDDYCCKHLGVTQVLIFQWLAI